MNKISKENDCSSSKQLRIIYSCCGEYGWIVKGSLRSVLNTFPGMIPNNIFYIYLVTVVWALADSKKTSRNIIGLFCNTNSPVLKKRMLSFWSKTVIYFDFTSDNHYPTNLNFIARTQMFSLSDNLINCYIFMQHHRS